MKVMISGASGFIGSRLSKRLSDQYQVVPITQEVLYQKEELRRLVDKEQPKYIFHLASYGNHSNQQDNSKILFANVLATYNIFEAANCKLFNFSTSSVLLPEQTMYSLTKGMGESLSQLYPNVVNVRPYSIFGEGEADFRFIPTVCRSLILGQELTLSPDAIHDWVYIENFIDILIRNLNTDSELLEIGTGMGTTNQEIVRKLAIISGKVCPIKVVSQLRSYDNSAWISPTGYKMKISLDVGLMRTYNYYERQFKN